MKRSVSLIVVFAVILSVILLCGCKMEKGARYIYTEGVKAVMDAEEISYDLKFSIGDSEYEMNVISADKGNKKNINLSSKNGDFEIYIDGNEHYYKTGDIKYKVSDEFDSPLMRGLLNMRFFNGEASLFDKDTFSDVDIEVLGENSKAITFEVEGSDLKKSFAPDEDVRFENTVIRVEFSGESFITKVSFATVISGKEFYGLPVGNEFDMEVSFEVLKLNGDSVVNEPENKNDWDELPAFAMLVPASLVYKDSMGLDVNTQINVSMGKIQMSVPMEVVMRSKLVDGKRLTRVITEMENNSVTQKNDVFTDGNGDFEYYTDPEGNYKVKIEDGESDEGISSDLIELYDLKNAKIKKSSANTVITVELTEEMLSKLGSSGAMSDQMGDFSADGMKYEKSELVIIVSSDGYIASAETKISGTQSVNQPQLGTEYTLSLTIKMDVVFVHPSENIEVEIPSGYLDYPLLEDNEA